jgi:hypothetical protein
LGSGDDARLADVSGITGRDVNLLSGGDALSEGSFGGLRTIEVLEV